jgi:UDP-N-acetylglucosamine 2-epimerase (non-hydrolysing)
LLILREKTERPEGISAGTSRLVGTDRDRIFGEVMALIESPERLAGMSRPVFPFGDGHAAPRIASIMVDWVQRRTLTYRLA